MSGNTSKHVRGLLVNMGAEQGGRRMTIRPEGKRSKPEVCANLVDGEWEPTPKYAKILGRKTPSERQDDAKATTAAKSEVPAGTGTGIPADKKRPPIVKTAKKAPVVKKKAPVKKKK